MAIRRRWRTRRRVAHVFVPYERSQEAKRRRKKKGEIPRERRRTETASVGADTWRCRIQERWSRAVQELHSERRKHHQRKETASSSAGTRPTSNGNGENVRKHRAIGCRKSQLGHETRHRQEAAAVGTENKRSLERSHPTRRSQAIERRWTGRLTECVSFGGRLVTSWKLDSEGGENTERAKWNAKPVLRRENNGVVVINPSDVGKTTVHGTIRCLLSLPRANLRNICYDSIVVQSLRSSQSAFFSSFPQFLDKSVFLCHGNLRGKQEQNQALPILLRTSSAQRS